MEFFDVVFDSVIDSADSVVGDVLDLGFEEFSCETDLH